MTSITQTNYICDGCGANTDNVYGWADVCVHGEDPSKAWLSPEASRNKNYDYCPKCRGIMVAALAAAYPKETVQ